MREREFVITASVAYTHLSLNPHYSTRVKATAVFWYVHGSVFSLTNSTSPSHALFFQSVRYIAFFKREISLQFICFRPRLAVAVVPRHASLSSPSKHSLSLNAICFTKLPYALVFSALFASACVFCVVFCLVFFSCVSFQEKVSIRQNVKTTLFKTLPEREKEREMSEFDSSSRGGKQLSYMLTAWYLHVKPGAVWSSNSGLRSWHHIKRDRSIQRDDMIQVCWWIASSAPRLQENIWLFAGRV